MKIINYEFNWNYDADDTLLIDFERDDGTILRLEGRGAIQCTVLKGPCRPPRDYKPPKLIGEV